MKPERRPVRRERRPLTPLDPARLNDLALAYVARFATSAAKLHDYLKRKLRERGWEGEDEAPLVALVERFVTNGYVDDTAFARSRSGSLLRRGYGNRRVDQALHAAGIAEEVRSEVRAGAVAQRAAALALARKRRLGPFGPPPADRNARERQIGTMLRAGHPLDSARELVNAISIEIAEDWAAAAEQDE